MRHPLHNYTSRSRRPYAPFHDLVNSRNVLYPYFLMNSSDSRYFLYLYPFFAKKPWIIGQSPYSVQSEQVSIFLSIKQQRFMAQRAARISRSSSSYPSFAALAGAIEKCTARVVLGAVAGDEGDLRCEVVFEIRHDM